MFLQYIRKITFCHLFYFNYTISLTFKSATFSASLHVHHSFILCTNLNVSSYSPPLNICEPQLASHPWPSASRKDAVFSHSIDYQSHPIRDDSGIPSPDELLQGWTLKVSKYSHKNRKSTENNVQFNLDIQIYTQYINITM